jgi:hypothetical protein
MAFTFGSSGPSPFGSSWSTAPNHPSLVADREDSGTDGLSKKKPQITLSDLSISNPQKKSNIPSFSSVFKFFVILAIPAC